jgi:hypothetical protein
MKKKEKVSPTTNVTPNTKALKASAKTMSDVPSSETIDRTVEGVVSEIKQDKVVPKERNQRKRETIKGTILQAVMIDVELLKKVKHNAFYNEKSISEVINQALRLFFD